MSKKTKIKYKKQFRLYDIYRYATTLEESRIEGFEYYNVDSRATVVNVKYEGDIISHHYTAKNEEDLKTIIRSVNYRLGNCHKPGPRRTHK